MTPGITYMLLYSASLAFIVLHLYSGVLKWVYRPKAYDEHFHELFPAQRAVGVIYLMQVFEIPYLLHIGEPAALLYVNAFAQQTYSTFLIIVPSPTRPLSEPLTASATATAPTSDNPLLIPQGVPPYGLSLRVRGDLLIVSPIEAEEVQPAERTRVRHFRTSTEPSFHTGTTGVQWDATLPLR